MWERRPTAACLLAAYPERVAKRRGGAGEFRLATGRGVFLDPDRRPAARRGWWWPTLAAGGRARPHPPRRRASTRTSFSHAVAERLETKDIIETDAAGRVRGKRVRRLGRLDCG